MLVQFKYTLRDQLTQRGTALIAVVVINILLKLIYGSGDVDINIVISSLLLLGMFGICIITDIDTIRNLFRKSGYLTILTPVHGSKILFPKIVTIVIGDIICMTVPVCGILWQINEKMESNHNPNIVLMAIIIILQYLLVVTAFFFGAAVAKSFLHSTKLSGLISVVVSVLVLYIISLSNLLLIPFGGIERSGLMTMVTIEMGMNLAMFIFIMIILIKSALLFLATAYLVERKINL